MLILYALHNCINVVLLFVSSCIIYRKTFGRLIVSIVFGALTFLMLIEACLVNVGLNKFCGNLSAVYTTVTG